MVLRSNIDEQPAVKGVEHSMATWRSFMAEREHREMAMEGSFDSFQDAIEGAMDSKYRELRGEGSFLIHEEASALLTGQSAKVPAEDRPVELTAEVQTWLKYADEEEDGAGICERQTHSVQQHDLSRYYEPPNGAAIAKLGGAGSTSRDGDSQPTAPVIQVCNGQMLDRTIARGAGLPNRTSSIRRKPIPGRETVTMPPSTTQTAESSRSPAPSKGRQDSAQTVVPRAMAPQIEATQSAQMQERYPLYTGKGRKQDPQ
jgi:hypothetical protein